MCRIPSARAPKRARSPRRSATPATPIYTLAHGYGPLDDFRRRLRVAHEASPHGLWINRYAYLTDRKLETIGEVARA